MLLKSPLRDLKKFGYEYFANSFASRGKSFKAETKFDINTIEINKLSSAITRHTMTTISLTPQFNWSNFSFIYYILVQSYCELLKKIINIIIKFCNKKIKIKVKTKFKIKTCCYTFFLNALIIIYY